VNPTDLASLVGLILALSIASERLVEIVKGALPFLNTENTNKTKEGWRQAGLHLLAVVAGVVTAYMASDYIPKESSTPVKDLGVVGLGLLASGGSSFWNSIATYMVKVKDLKKAEVEDKKSQVPPAAQ
jgi:hypothetical protein